ncbi:ubiquitin-like-specific protease 2 [Drosophila mauritiana]|uniref:Ubiquitin-like-specific protease 2 n=1 Tax=Drosophila mauritiana TaxID=7226 RepID=A0A6P8LAL1_DROMA|nr:ubiquitin-like-specific protease 2 [Drosophila mauritiana]
MVSRIAHNDFIIVSRQLLINRADTDKDKQSAKVLIIYSTGKQHIVTFKLPIHAFTVQKLFLKMNLHMEDNITIDCMENAGGIIHLVVSVGFAIGDTIADKIAKAEQFYKKVHQSRASADAAPRNAVPVEEPPSLPVVKPSVVSPSETSVANNGCQPSATKGKKHKKKHRAPGDTNADKAISSANQDANTPKTKKQKKCHSAEDSNGYQVAGAQDNPGSSGNKQGNQTPTGNTSNSPKKSNGLQGVQPAGDALASSQSIQSKDQVAHATVSKKSEETAGGSQSRVQPNVASIPAPAEKATSDTIPTPAERVEKSRLRRNSNWIISRDFDDEVIVLLSSEDEETTAADNGQTEGRLSVDENPTLFTYPPTGTGGLSITIKDYMCLKEGSFLNDIIIDFYLRWLKNNIVPEGQRDRTHIFSTFFHMRLTTETSPNNTKEPVAKRRHERVKKWTRTVNIFEKDFIIIPFNEKSHWILAIICFPNLKTSVVNHDVQTPGEDIPIKQPLILIFDSLEGNSRDRDIAILHDYLNFEYKAKYPKERARIFNGDNMPGLIVEVPQQENLTDCGLYLLQYAEQFFTKPIVNYKLPIRELIDWFDLLTVTKKREDIANLIQKLMNEGNQQGITLPVIKFPTLNGIMVMDVDDDKEWDTEEENQTINQYSFETRTPPKRRHTLQ